MEADDKKEWKKLKITSPIADPDSSDDQNKNRPAKGHSSQGHSTDAKGTATNTREHTLRATTTDSSRAPKNSNDDGPTGGNVR